MGGSVSWCGLVWVEFGGTGGGGGWTAARTRAYIWGACDLRFRRSVIATPHPRLRAPALQKAAKKAEYDAKNAAYIEKAKDENRGNGGSFLGSMGFKGKSSGGGKVNSNRSKSGKR